MFHDPIVDEVRAIREQLAAQSGFDIRKIIEAAQKRQVASKSRIVSYQQPTSLSGEELPAMESVQVVCEKPSRLASECAKLDPVFEKALAEEGLTDNSEQ
jgi:hypothetical protein